MNTKMQQVNIKDINTDGPIRNPVLPTGFIERVQKFKNILAEVETMTLEQTVANFQKDQHPESELKLWERMASAYQTYVEANSQFNLEEKKDVLEVLLGLSMGVEEFSSTKYLNLNAKQIKDLDQIYTNP